MNKEILDDLSTYKCMKCACIPTHPDPPWKRRGTHKECLTRVGLETTNPRQLVANTPEYKALNRVRDAIEKDLKACASTEDVNLLLNTTPRPYPTSCPMPSDTLLRHAIHGRRMEISLMCYKVNPCSCCGRVQPNHEDSMFLRKDTKRTFPTDAFNNKSFDGWHCNCDDFCKGSQFWAASRRTQIDLYKHTHNGQLPWEFLGIRDKKPNASLCNKCHMENSASKGDERQDSGLLLDMKFARKFASRDGFGKDGVPQP